MKLIDNIIFRLVLYYGVNIAFFLGLSHIFPSIPRYVALERMRAISQSNLNFNANTSLTAPIPEEFAGYSDLLNPEFMILVLLSLIGAFFLTVPVIWVYRWTHSGKRYNKIFAHTLLLVPTAIALVVFLVKGSLALAFSLAGIVAAVRFRTTLKESLDAVYMFVTIGIGLAAGVHLMMVAFTASVFFNAIALFVWRTNYAAKPVLLSGFTIMEPQIKSNRIQMGDLFTRPFFPSDVKEGKPFNAQLRIHSNGSEAAQRTALSVLKANTSRWRVTNVDQLDDETAIVDLDIRIRKSVDPEDLLQQMEICNIGKVELKQLAAKKA